MTTSHHLTPTEVQFIRAALERPDELSLADLPPGISALLREVLAEMEQGHAVQVLPVGAELTTQQAADILGVSRPTMAQLLDKGRIPSWKVGTHRRVRLEEVVTFSKTQAGVSARALQELADLDQEMGLI